MKNGKKTIVLFVVLALIFGGAFLSEHMRKQKIEQRHQEQARYEQERDQLEQELIQIAKNTEIGNGVTLNDGVRAYCGTNGDWSAFNGTIFLEAHGSTHWIDAAFEVNEETGLLDLLEFDSDLHPANSDEVEDIISDMIQAAK